MDIEIVRAKMMKQVEAARVSAMAGVMGWDFEIDDLAVFVGMKSRKERDASFLLRAMFADFPRRAPSYVFVDRVHREITDRAWPPNVRHNDRDLPGICTPGTCEFHEKWHHDDKRYPWNESVFTFLDTLCRIQGMMEGGHK